MILERSRFGLGCTLEGTSLVLVMRIESPLTTGNMLMGALFNNNVYSLMLEIFYKYTCMIKREGPPIIFIFICFGAMKVYHPYNMYINSFKSLYFAMTNYFSTWLIYPIRNIKDNM